MKPFTYLSGCFLSARFLKCPYNIQGLLYSLWVQSLHGSSKAMKHNQQHIGVRFMKKKFFFSETCHRAKDYLPWWCFLSWNLRWHIFETPMKLTKFYFNSTFMMGEVWQNISKYTSQSQLKTDWWQAIHLVIRAQYSTFGMEDTCLFIGCHSAPEFPVVLITLHNQEDEKVNYLTVVDRFHGLLPKLTYLIPKSDWSLYKQCMFQALLFSLYVTQTCFLPPQNVMVPTNIFHTAVG